MDLSWCCGSNRYRCVLLDKILGFEFRPELGWNRRLHRGVVGEDLLLATGTDDQRRCNIGCPGELQRCGSEIDPRLSIPNRCRLCSIERLA
jgi:hypothetical protein